MGNTRLTKVRHMVTHLGCIVSAERTMNPQTGRIDEEMTLSHPRPIHEVAYSIEGQIAKAHSVFDREARR